MNPDLALAAGVVLLALSLPALIAGWAERRFPRFGAVLLLAALGLVATATMLRPEGYRLEEVPQVLLSVLAMVLN